MSSSIQVLHIYLYIYWVRHLTFFLSTQRYFVNGNTQLISDLTDNQFYPSAKRIQNNKYFIHIYIIGSAIQRFFSTKAYFVNGNTELMSDLTENQFYPSTKRIWLCIRLKNALLSGPAIDLQKMTILAKKKNKNHLFR